MLIGGLASAGASAAGAKMASSSAKGAAKTQTTVANRAAALSTQAWQQQQALQAPYQQAGRSAIGNLNALMQPGQPYTPQMQQQNNRAAMAGPIPAALQAPPGGAMGTGGAPGPGPMPTAGAGAMGAAMAPQGDMVPMVSRDGERGMVPRSQVQRALAAGARVAQ